MNNVTEVSLEDFLDMVGDPKKLSPQEGVEVIHSIADGLERGLESCPKHDNSFNRSMLKMLRVVGNALFSLNEAKEQIRAHQDTISTLEYENHNLRVCMEAIAGEGKGNGD